METADIDAMVAVEFAKELAKRPALAKAYTANPIVIGHAWRMGFASGFQLGNQHAVEQFNKLIADMRKVKGL